MSADEGADVVRGHGEGDARRDVGLAPDFAEHEARHHADDAALRVCRCRSARTARASHIVHGAPHPAGQKQGFAGQSQRFTVCNRSESSASEYTPSTKT